MSKIKATLAGWLRAIADKIDPSPVVVQGGGGHGEE